MSVSRRSLLLSAGFLSLTGPSLSWAQAAEAVRPGVFEKGSKRFAVDMLGRTVEIPAAVKRVVCTGTGAPRIVAYLEALDRLVGIESSDKIYANDPKRDYAYAHHERFKKLPVIGKGGGSSFTANPEAILALEPDVIFTGYTSEAAEQLTRETGLPVVSVGYRSLGLVHPTFLQSIALVGEILGVQKRSKAILDFVASVRTDLARRVADVDVSKSPTVYPGAVTFSGSHGFSGTYNKFGPLTAVKARSISDKPGREGFYDADLEFVLNADPQIIFLDPGNLPIVRQEVQNRRGYFESLSAVKNKRVYSLPSYNQYSTNVAYSLANAYYVGSVLHPERFADVDFPRKFDEIVAFFNGKGWYEVMGKTGQGYGPLELL